MNKCAGCGIILQTQDKTKLGYTPKITNQYCERCFKTIHYNEEIKVNNISNEHIIQKINKLNKFTIFITDLFNLNEEVIAIYQKIKNPKILVINKCDLIPNNLKLEHLEENIQKVYNLDEVFFISSKEEWYLNKIMNLIVTNKEVIFCGETSSGKSTLINKLLNTNLTTSKYANTTLDIIKLVQNDYVIYDTPGFLINQNTLYKEIKVLTKKLKPDYVLIFDDLKISGNGNITIYGDSQKEIVSKKGQIDDHIVYQITKPSDILISNGFIYIKDKMVIKSNQKLEIRDSIIK